MYGTPARKFCDWDRIPSSDINPSHPVIKSRTRSFADLEKLAFEGLNYHWGRNKNHFIAKDLKVNNESHELYMHSANTNENAIGKIELIYNTNGNWARSGNPGTMKDPMSVVGNIVSRQAICYNVGNIYYLDWYEPEFYENKSILSVIKTIYDPTGEHTLEEKKLSDHFILQDSRYK